MKKLFVALAAIGLFFASCEQEPKYKLTGKITGQAEGKVYLSKVQDNDLVKVDSAQLQEGAFEFAGSVTSPELFFIQLDGKKETIQFFIENSNIDIKADVEKLQEAVITGSAEQAVYDGYVKSQKPFAEKNNTLRREFMAARGANDKAKMDSIRSAASEMQAEAEAAIDEFLTSNANSIASGYVKYRMTGNMKLEKMEEMYNALPENVKASVYGNLIKDKIDLQKSVAIGKPAPDFTLNTPEETPFSLSSLKGKVVVIDFWASWCGPCRAENPHMVELYKEVNEKGVEFLGVSLDDNKDNWLKAIEADGLIWKHVSDLKGWNSKASRMYGVTGIPATVLLDQNGVIVAKNLRSADLKVEIEKLLQ
ncbi:redoxin domain-containing protein [Marinifilum sp.]|uniref:redoxin domain-containing protein n=1 Tax=Marinifilum sp. TaxID=2033137 RepID=UPI003BACE376